MPTFVNPRRVIVEPRGAGLAELIALAVVAGAGVVVAEVVAAYAVVIFAVTITIAAATVAGLVVYLRRQGPMWKPEALTATQSAGQVAPVRSRQPVPDRPVAAILARQVPPATTVLSAEVIREKVTR